MSLNDPLANALSQINNYEKKGKKEVLTASNSKLIRNVIKLMQEEGLIGDFQQVENGKGDLLKINLIGALNKCGVIKPRFRIKFTDFVKYEKRYLPAMNFGVIIVSTNKGLMTHKQAKEKGIGGTLICFAY